MLVDSDAEALIELCVIPELDVCDGLSNGDKIILKWDCDGEIAEEYFNCKLKYSDIIYEVKGLEEIQAFNPFDYVEISFSGVSPKGSIEITPDYNQPEMQYITFSADSTSGLALGETVNVKASISGSEDSFVEKFGSIIGKNEEIYIVEGIAKYITDISELPQKVYDEMDGTLRDVLASDFESWDNEELKNMQLLGTYLVMLKEGKYSYNNINNYLYFVYKITAENDESDGEFSYYWYGYYNNVNIFDDGTCGTKINTYNVPDKGWFASEVVKFDRQRNYSYYGFKELDSFYNKHIVDKVENYEFKSTVSEK